ncbi:MAG: DNA double-strand break repair nuclease NurA [Thermoproteota archaeon]|nr:DNA double-strand break repair nuclease NurA [Thermoproteota archaeon]
MKGKEVEWSYEERIRPLVGSIRVRRRQLQDIRMKLESELALKMLDKVGEEGSYLLLDGAGYFGKKKSFHVSLYEKCKKKGVILLAVSKRSPTLRDEKGRYPITTIYSFSRSHIWIYHPVLRADKKHHLYGDVSIVKLCGDSPRVFRCDVMEYLTNCEITELLSPLTFISEDPHCLGHPVALWLAHDFQRHLIPNFFTTMT